MIKNQLYYGLMAAAALAANAPGSQASPGQNTSSNARNASHGTVAPKDMPKEAKPKATKGSEAAKAELPPEIQAALPVEPKFDKITKNSPRYLVVKKSFLNNRTYEEGEEVNDYFGLPGIGLKPLNDSARELFREARETQQAQRGAFNARAKQDMEHFTLYGERPAPQMNLTGAEITAIQAGLHALDEGEIDEDDEL